MYAKAPNALKAAAIPAVVAASGLSQPLDLFSASDDVEVLDGSAAATPVRNSSSEQLLPGVVVSGIPGLRAVPDLVTIHPILPPTVHIQPYHD